MTRGGFLTRETARRLGDTLRGLKSRIGALEGRTGGLNGSIQRDDLYIAIPQAEITAATVTPTLITPTSGLCDVFHWVGATLVKRGTRTVYNFRDEVVPAEIPVAIHREWTGGKFFALGCDCEDEEVQVFDSGGVSVQITNESTQDWDLYLFDAFRMWHVDNFPTAGKSNRKGFYRIPSVPFPAGERLTQTFSSVRVLTDGFSFDPTIPVKEFFLAAIERDNPLTPELGIPGNGVPLTYMPNSRIVAEAEWSQPTLDVTLLFNEWATSPVGISNEFNLIFLPLWDITPLTPFVPEAIMNYELANSEFVPFEFIE